jgi:hypothetical protein
MRTGNLSITSVESYSCTKLLTVHDVDIDSSDVLLSPSVSAQSITLLICFRDVFDSNLLDQGTGCFASVSLHKYRDIIANYVSTVTFHITANSLFTNNLPIDAI